MNEQNKSTLKTVGICILAVVVIAVVGISFAYFTVNYEIGDTYSIGGKASNTNPIIEFSENKSGISLDGTYPMPDEVGLEKSDEYTFTVTGKESTRNIKVHVYLQVADVNTLDDNLVNISFNGKIKIVGSLETGNPIDDGFNKAYKIGEFIIEPDGSDTNSIKMWVNESGTVDNALGKSWNSKIYVLPEFTDEVVPVNFVQALLAKRNDSSKTDYNSGNKGEMYTFSHPEAIQTTGWSEEERIDYRYIGNEPNNYIQFNNETWRIIGVFIVEGENGEKEQRIKIIRDESIGNFSWDKKADVTYINEWPSSSLGIMLNGDYVNKGDSFTYTWYDLSGTANDSTVQGLNSTAKSQIAASKWYLGGNNTSSVDGPAYYNFERGTTVYSGHSTNTIAKVGLMYPSDYVYTYAYGVDNTCYTNGFNCQTSTSGIPNAGWLINPDARWTIAPYAFYPYSAFNIRSGGDVNSVRTDYSNGVCPCVYLRSDIEIIGGDGSAENPYILKV